MGEPSIDSLHDQYEDQLSAARYKAERDQLRQRVDALEEQVNDVEDMYRCVLGKWMDETKKAKRLGHLVWRLQNRLARSHRREKQLRKGMREWREKVIGAPVRTVSAYDLLPEEDLRALRWVREQGGLNSVKKLLDWVVGHCSTRQQLDFDFWLSGRVMHELGFEEDMADRGEVERRLLARLMPEGYEWPRYESGEPLRYEDRYVYDGREREVWHVDFDSYGEPTILNKDGTRSHTDKGERVNRPAPKVLAADGVEIRAKETVFGKNTGEELIVTGFEDGRVWCEHRMTDADALPVRGMWSPDQLTHERPDSWERLEEDLGDEMAKQQCGPISPELACSLAGEFVRRCLALAERERGE